MENKRLQLLQSFIGKPFSGSPSPYTHWLNGIIISANDNIIAEKYWNTQSLFFHRPVLNCIPKKPSLRVVEIIDVEQIPGFAQTETHVPLYEPPLPRLLSNQNSTLYYNQPFDF